jgi:hypothetical protein
LVLISTTVTADSDPAKLGIPVGAQLAAENGTGNWVAVLNDKVVGRVDAKGVWQVEDLYPIDKAKLFNNMPKSYEELTANLGNYVEAPDATTPEFLDWWKNKLLPVLGEESTLPRNVDVLFSGIPVKNELLLPANTATAKSLLSPPEFFYFQHGGEVYPVLVLSTVSYMQGTTDINQTGTVTLILTNSTMMEEGWGSLSAMAQGKPVISLQLFQTAANASWFPDDCGSFLAAGLDGSIYEGIANQDPNQNIHHWRIPVCGRIQTSFPK